LLRNQKFDEGLGEAAIHVHSSWIIVSKQHAMHRSICCLKAGSVSGGTTGTTHSGGKESYRPGTQQAATFRFQTSQPQPIGMLSNPVIGPSRISAESKRSGDIGRILLLAPFGYEGRGGVEP
jgi:hypothetical protein